MKKFIRLISIILVTALIGCGLSGCYNSDIKKYFQSGFDFNNLYYSKPQGDRFYELADFAEENRDSFFRAFKICDAITEMIDILYDFYYQSSILEIFTNLDITNEYYNEAQYYVESQLPLVYDRLWQVMDEVSKSTGGWWFNYEYGKDYVEYFFGSSYLLKTTAEKEIDNLYNTEAELLKDYHSLLNVTYTIIGDNYIFDYELPEGAKTFIDNEDGTRSWVLTEEDIYTYYTEGFIGDTTYNEMLFDLYSNMAEDYGELYIKLAETRKEIAELSGYYSFKAYSNAEDYGRSYALDGITEAYNNLALDFKQKISSAYYGLDFGELLTAADTRAAEIYEGGVEVFAKKILDLIDGSFAAPYNEMIGTNTYNTAYAPEKNDISFTSYISMYGYPFLFVQPGETATCEDLSTFFHEFGHYYQFYYSYDLDWVSLDLDSSEVMSQGLELLVSDRYGNIYEDSEVADNAQKKLLAEMTVVILNSFMLDEFQTLVFEEKNLTTERISEIYCELLAKYGLVGAAEKDGLCYDWLDIYHVFEYPFYNLSYGISAVAALEIYFSEDNVSSYVSFQSNADSMSITENCEALGLGNPTEYNTIKQVIEKALSFINN